MSSRNGFGAGSSNSTWSAIFLTVLHRLLASGSDRWCDLWKRDGVVEGTENLSPHQLYRAMSYLGGKIGDQNSCTPFSPLCTKDPIEEDLHFARRDFLTKLEMVFFDTTSVYFEGSGGDSLGERGNSKDHRPDLKRMVIGVVVDDSGRPICCEMWPGNTTDVKTLVPIVDRMRKRFGIEEFRIVSDRGMIGAATMKQLEDPERDISHIPGARMRKANEVKREVLSRAGRFRDVVPEGGGSKDPAPLKVKEVLVGDNRYVVRLNTKQALKDKADRETIVEALTERIKFGPKAMIGSKGYRKFLKVTGNSIVVDEAKIEAEARFDGKWALKTNTDLPAEEVVLQYKELWRVEHVFRDMKSILETRPIFHHHGDC